MKEQYDVVIIGGSYAGLSAAMTLGRALRNVLVIDSGKPCNAPTPHSHNFLTQDGNTPSEIAAIARKQVEQYDTIQFLDGIAKTATKEENSFSVTTAAGESFSSKKLVIATGLKDIMPPIEGFEDCWGKSVLHCPYCHGYEVRHQKTGVMANGEMGHFFAKLISNWTDELTLFTNGKSTLTAEQTQQLEKHNIQVNENEITKINHDKGYISSIELETKEVVNLDAMYCKIKVELQGDFIQTLGCKLDEQGLIETDPFQQTTVEGVYACGDNSAMRSLPNAVSTGATVGAAINVALVDEKFNS